MATSRHGPPAQPSRLTMCVCAVVLVLLLARCAVALEFYPYGPAYDSQLPRQDDISSQEIHLKVPIRFYDETYSSVFVSWIA